MPFTVDDFHDLLRVLEERPEWRVELRRVVLTDDLLRLPEELTRARQETDQRFRELTTRLDALTAQVAELTARLDALAAQVAELTTRLDALAAQVAELTTRLDALAAQVAGLASRVDALTTQVGTIAGHVGTLRGESLEQRYRTRVFSYFGRLLGSSHALTPDELTALLEAAIEAATLSIEDAHDIAETDLVVRGRRPTDGSTAYLVVEVSVGVGPGDVDRAKRRAALLARTGVGTLPVVAGEWVTPEGADAARRLHVWQLTDGRVIAPDGPPT
jgi:uncharacterized protein YoxC